MAIAIPIDSALILSALVIFGAGVTFGALIGFIIGRA
jgi:hypothetical protein